MGDVESLLMVIGVVYLTECATWVQRSGVGFYRYWSGDWKLWHPTGVLGNARGAILLGNPLPPLGPTFASYPFPLSVSPEAVYSYSASSVNPGWRAPQSARFVPLDEIRSMGIAQKKLWVNDAVFHKASSVPAAFECKKLIQALRDAAPTKRERLIQEHIDAGFDGKRIEDRLGDFKKHSRVIQVSTHVLFFFLFGVAFPIVAIYGLTSTWAPLLGTLLAQTVFIAVLFHRAHRRLHPLADEERFTRFLTMLLAPPTAIRAADLLGRNILESFHPLAVARVLCDPERFKRFAQIVLRDAHHPFGPPIVEANASLPVRTELFFRQCVIARMEKFLQSAGLNPESLLRAPDHADPANRSYCPRCHALFVHENGDCHDCGGVPLAPL